MEYNSELGGFFSLGGTGSAENFAERFDNGIILNWGGFFPWRY